MKHMNDGNDDSSRSNLHSDGSDSSASRGRRLEFDEDSPFSDLSAVYACSDQAQFAALDATSGIFVREVAHYLGLAGPDLTIPYKFAPLAETIRRHGRRKRRRPRPASSVRHESSGKNAEQESAAQESAATDGKRTATSSRKKDRGAGRRLRRDQQETRQNPEPLPDFPAFSPTSTFNGWTHQYTWADDISEYCALLGATTSGAYRHITSAMTLVYGLPKFHQRCCDGDFTIEHVAFVTRRCRDVEFRYLPSIDDYLADRRADITIETFKRSLALKIAATQPAEETLEKTAVRRRVDFSAGDDGTAYLTLSGPAPELQACYRRIEAFARDVYKGNTTVFGDQLNPGDTFDEDRGIDALMFDIFTRTRPQLKLRITSNNTTTGETSSTDFPLDGFVAGPDGVPRSPEESLLDYIERTFGQMDDENSPPAESEGQGRNASDSWLRDPRFLEALVNSRPSPGGSFSGRSPSGAQTRPPPGSGSKAQSASASSSTDDDSSCAVDYTVLLDMPTGESWLSQQARMTFTVPLLTLLSQILDDPGDTADMAAARTPRAAATDETQIAEAVGSAPANDPDDERASADVCDLAGMLPDGSPLPADMARKLAGYASTWTRILTDPATGTPLDAKATSYSIPKSVRQTLAAQWMNCTMPGCTRRAEVTEVDHIVPFDHASPQSGGLTRFGNLHNLCKLHHQAKTDRKFSVVMAEPGRLEYIFKHGITTEVLPPDNPINVEHARLFLKYFSTTPPQPSTPAQKPSDAEAPQTKNAHEDDSPSAQEQSPSARSDATQSPTLRSDTAQSTTVPSEDGQALDSVEYVVPFSGQPEQDARQWFWGSDEPPPF